MTRPGMSRGGEAGPRGVHATAVRGFDLAADVYARARPDYPDAAVDHVVRALRGGASGPVLDVAAGTGKLTAALAARDVQVTAVEPVEGMRKACLAALPDLPVVAATAEDLPFADGSIAGVTVAQAFHWFDPVAATASFARCLMPGGLLAVLFNVRDESVAWVRALTAIIDPHETDGKKVPRYRDQGWRSGFTPDGPFDVEDVIDLPNAQEMDASGLRERVASISFIAVLDDDARAAVMDDVSTLVRTHPDVAGRVAFPFPYVTEIHHMRRRG